MLFLGADHAGLEQKEFVAHKLAADGISFEDFGAFSPEPRDDYPIYATRVSREVIKEKGKGILFCGSGEGMAIVANRHKGVRAVVAWKPEIAREAREDNDANILSIPARFLTNDEAWEIVRTFLATSFSHEERHKRRIRQIDEGRHES
jgi:ribose 5-phosphate isomerase B